MKILNFYVKGDKQCEFQREILKKLTDVKIVNVNCMTERQPVFKYDIKIAPTLIILNNKDEFCNKLVGVTELNIIKSILDKIKD